MNLNELQSVQSRERQTDSLQQLRDSFYQEVGRFIQQLKEERQDAAQRADDPFDSTDVQRLTDEIKTAEETVEAIYERRVGKLVKQASLEAAGMAADAEGLTAEEQRVFERLVETIERNREHVLDGVIANGGEAPIPADPTPDAGAADATSAAAGTPDGEPAADVTPPGRGTQTEPGTGATPDASAEGNATGADAEGDGGTGRREVPPDTPPAEQGGVSAADAMGGGPSNAGESSDDGGDGSDGVHAVPPGAPPGEESADAPGGEGSSGGSAPDGSGSDDAATGDRGASYHIERATVRITADVGEILGVDERAYELASDDVVTLPEANAGPLLQQGAAERLD